MTEPITLKMRSGNLLIPVSATQEDGRLFLSFPYNKTLLEEIKAMEGRKWHGYDERNPRKIWSIPLTSRNMFTLEFLCNKKPYAPYDAPLPTLIPARDVLREHQKEMFSHGMTRKQCILACEMGTGKTLVAIEIMEASGFKDWIYVGPLSALRSVEYEFNKWKSKVIPKFLTYDGLKKYVSEVSPGTPAPHGLICDESSRCKNYSAQRTQATKHLADAIRNEYGREGYVILMSGTPAPRTPVDWWAQCEIACPGFIKEGDPVKFRHRLGLVVQKESTPGGGAYPFLKTWRDDVRKCQVCGEFEDALIHMPGTSDEAHVFQKSINEVEGLYKRLKGLVLIKFKRDCLDLPEKQFKLHELKPSRAMMNAAKLIVASAPNTITAMTLLRELSDGFQYTETQTGMITCDMCNGKQYIMEAYDLNHPELYLDSLTLTNGKWESGEALRLAERKISCHKCSGLGEIYSYERTIEEIPTPKDDLLRDLLEEHEEIGRFVIYGGFTGTIDRITNIVKNSGWGYIRADGRGWIGFDALGNPLDNRKFLQIFQDGKSEFERIAFIGQAGAAGLGLNLTASPGLFYFSNTFDGEARMQSMDRIHRMGMDLKLGATIHDCVLLPTDRVVLDNLNKKVRLQDMSMGVLKEAIENDDNTVTRK